MAEKRSTRLAHIALALALLGGCAATHSEDEQLALLQRVSEAECARALSCESWTSLTYWPCGPAWLPGARAEVLAGHAHVDLDAARACLAGIAALGDCALHVANIVIPLDPAQALEETCRAVWVQDRGACGASVCDPGEACVAQPDCTLACTHSAHAGEACGAIGCDLGLDCTAGVCVARAPSVPCHGGGLSEITACIHYRLIGDACTGFDCGPTAYCAPDTHVCRDDPAALPQGAACDAAASPGCVDTLTCMGGTCVSGATATGTCSDRFSCGPSSFCEADGTCGADSEGAFCSGRSIDLYWLDECGDGFLCGPDQHCHRPVAAGAACDATTACPLGTLCAAGHCATIADEGDACDPATPCRHATSCIEGVCTRANRPGRPGGLCLADGTCTIGRCDGTLCAWLPIGSPCTDTAECPTCVGGTCAAPITLERGAACSIGSPATGVCGDGLTCAYGWPSVGPAFCCPS